jgi:hypothetical protein
MLFKYIKPIIQTHRGQHEELEYTSKVVELNELRMMIMTDEGSNNVRKP